MAKRFFDVIDWGRPWLKHILPVAQPILQADDWRLALNAAAEAAGLQNHHGLQIHFVPQEDLPAGVAYEAFISATGGVPTRNNLHDFFNALVWLTFPRIKTQLNALQAEEIEKSLVIANDASAGQGRGRLRDAATIFDENAALLVTSNATLANDLREHRWQEVFLTKRAEFERQCELWLFGHALMEKLVHPYKGITAHAWPVIVDDEFFKMPTDCRHVYLDRMVKNQLRNELTTSDFMPLPVLGMPGWSDRQDNNFYSDVSVFRPKKVKLVVKPVR